MKELNPWTPKDGLLVRHIEYNNLALISKCGPSSTEYEWMLVPLGSPYLSPVMFNVVDIVSEKDDGYIDYDLSISFKDLERTKLETLYTDWVPLPSGTVVEMEQE